MDDYYNNHGWLSVSLYVATAIDFGIGMSVEIGCGLSSFFV